MDTSILIQAGDSFRFKIGRSVAPERRIKEMQVGSAVKLKLLCQKECPDMCAQEDRWHELFDASRKHGEWFDLDEKQLPKIVTALKGDIGVLIELLSSFENARAMNLPINIEDLFTAKTVE